MKIINHCTRKLRKYIFRTPTTNIELSNAAIALGYSIVFLLTGDVLVQDPAYDHFIFKGDTWIWLAILITSTIQLIASTKDSLRADQLGAWLLKCSGFLWAIAAILFGFATTVNPAFFTCAVLSFMAVLAAFEIDERNLDRLKEDGGGD